MAEEKTAKQDQEQFKDFRIQALEEEVKVLHKTNLELLNYLGQIEGVVEMQKTYSNKAKFYREMKKLIANIKEDFATKMEDMNKFYTQKDNE
jgi:hypothetical protein